MFVDSMTRGIARNKGSDEAVPAPSPNANPGAGADEVPPPLAPPSAHTPHGQSGSSVDAMAPMLSFSGKVTSGTILHYGMALTVALIALIGTMCLVVPSSVGSADFLPGRRSLWPPAVYATALFYEVVQQSAGGRHTSRGKTGHLPLLSLLAMLAGAVLDAIGAAPVVVISALTSSPSPHAGFLVFPVRLALYGFNTLLMLGSLWMMGSNPRRVLWQCVAISIALLSSLSALLAAAADGRSFTYSTLAAIAAAASLAAAAERVLHLSRGACIATGSPVRPVSQTLLCGTTLACLASWPATAALVLSGAMSRNGELFAWQLTEAIAALLFTGCYVSSMQCYNEFVFNCRHLKVEELLHSNIQQLVKATEQKRNLLAAVTHELRTPLNGIIGLMESALSQPNDVSFCREFREVAETVRNCGNRLHGLVSQLLQCANKSWDAMADPSNCSVVSAGRILHEIVKLMRPMVPKDVKLLTNIPEPAPEILVEYDSMMQVFYNLLGNAVKFCSKGHITVSVSEDDNEVEITVQDTGIGIPADKLQMIFEPFEQVDQTDTRKYGGVGLGLALAKSIVNANHGTIDVKSSVNVGSTFIVRLPKPVKAPEIIAQLVGNQSCSTPTGGLCLTKKNSTPSCKSNNPTLEYFDLHAEPCNNIYVAQDCPESGSIEAAVVEQATAPQNAAISPSVTIAAANIAQSMLSARAKRLAHRVEILCVDDDVINQKVIRNMFKSSEYSISTANDGQEALDILKEKFDKSHYEDFPDVILMDLMMPRVNGIEAVKLIRENYHDAPLSILMLSANNSQDVVVDGFDAGCNDYIIKPFKRADLLARTGSHIRSLKFWLDQAQLLQQQTGSHMSLPVVENPWDRDGRHMIESYDNVAILCCDFDNLESVLLTVPSHELITLVDNIICEFNSLADKMGIHKAESAGTAYTVVVYDGDKSTDTVADRAIELGRRMLDVAKGAVASSGVCLNIRIGMHVGSAHAGFVDGKVPRYCFFGDSMDLAIRMQLEGCPMCIHVTDDVRKSVSGSKVSFQESGIIVSLPTHEAPTWLVLPGEGGAPSVGSRSRRSSISIRTESLRLETDDFSSNSSDAVARDNYSKELLRSILREELKGFATKDDLGKEPAWAGSHAASLQCLRTDIQTISSAGQGSWISCKVLDNLEGFLTVMQEFSGNADAKLARLEAAIEAVERPEAGNDSGSDVGPGSTDSAMIEADLQKKSSKSKSKKAPAFTIDPPCHESSEGQDLNELQDFMIAAGLDRFLPILQLHDIDSLQLARSLTREDLSAMGISSLGVWKRLQMDKSRGH